MLAVEGLHAHYGRAHVLRGIAFTVAPGEVLALMGRNGAGKSTTLKAIMHLVPPSAGRVVVAGRDLDGLEPPAVARLGVGYVPEDRRVFPGLTVAENLEVGRRPPRAGLAPWTVARVEELFPALARLRHRRAGALSGGEQQMLTVARTLMGNPAVLLLDEPSEGLAPVVVDAMVAAIRALKADGLAIVLSEQNWRFARGVADRVLLLETGAARFAGTLDALDRQPALMAEVLGI